VSAADVLIVLNLLEEAGIAIWVDGGWGVDALLGVETRPHNDLDIALGYTDLAGFRRTMADRGFREIANEGPFNFVLRDEGGRLVDVHVVDLEATRTDDLGRNVYGSSGLAYEVGCLEGIGTIAGRRVQCCTAEFQVRSHTGYKIDDNDIRDVMALHTRFGIPLPREYRPD